MQFNTWIKPLTCGWAPPKSLFDEDEGGLFRDHDSGNAEIIVSANARKVVQYVEEHFWQDIVQFFAEHGYTQLALSQKRHAIAERTPRHWDQARSIKATDDLIERAQTTAPLATTDQGNGAIPAINTRIFNGLQPHYTFEHFVIGKSNQLAHSAALQVSERPGQTYNPFYLYGGVGLGKTHLAQAIGNVLMSKRGFRVRYINADDYFNEVAKAVRHNTYEQFKQDFRSLDAIIIDDVQLLQNRERTQEELFYLFNTLMETGRQVIVTSDRYPRDLEKIQERLRSRFQWGLTVAIEPPEMELRVAIIQRKAEQKNCEIDTPSAYYIARHLKSNVREFEGALTKILHYAKCHELPINVDTVRLALKDIVGQVSAPLSIESIQKSVCEFYKVRTADMFSKSRTRDLVQARQTAMWLVRALTTLSLPQIGEAFGGRDHTTVMHACKCVEELRQKNHEFNQRLRILEQMLRGD